MEFESDALTGKGVRDIVFETQTRKLKHEVQPFRCLLMSKNS